MGISVWQLLIIFAIVLVLFGAKRLRNVGGDLGSAIKGFRSAVRETEDEGAAKKESLTQANENKGQIIEGEVTSKEKDKV